MMRAIAWVAGGLCDFLTIRTFEGGEIQEKVWVPA